MARGRNRPEEEITDAPTEETAGDVGAATDELALLRDENERLRIAYAAKLGVDAAVAGTMMNTKTRLVQFTRMYSFGGRNSTIGNQVLVPGYSVVSGEVVHLREGEVIRLQKKKPGHLITDPSKFKSQTLYSTKWDHEKRKVVKTETIVPAEDLVKSASVCG